MISRIYYWLLQFWCRHEEWEFDDHRTCEWKECRRCHKREWQKPYLPPDYLSI